MQTIQQDINVLAKQCGVDPSVIEQAAHAVARRVHDWTDGDIGQADQLTIETALHDHAGSMKRCAVNAYSKRNQFSQQILVLLTLDETELA